MTQLLVPTSRSQSVLRVTTDQRKVTKMLRVILIVLNVTMVFSTYLKVLISVLLVIMLSVLRLRFLTVQMMNIDQAKDIKMTKVL